MREPIYVTVLLPPTAMNSLFRILSVLVIATRLITCNSHALTACLKRQLNAVNIYEEANSLVIPETQQEFIFALTTYKVSI